MSLAASPGWVSQGAACSDSWGCEFGNAISLSFFFFFPNFGRTVAALQVRVLQIQFLIDSKHEVQVNGVELWLLLSSH